MIQLEVLTLTNKNSFVESLRTCIGCRARNFSFRLLRLVIITTRKGINFISTDPVPGLPGRGAWLHSKLHCTQLALSKQAFNKAFKLKTSPDISKIFEYIKETSEI